MDTGDGVKASDVIDVTKYFRRGVLNWKAPSEGRWRIYRFGYNLTRTSYGQVNDGERVERDQLQPGDLVFFAGRAIGRRVGHVGIVTRVNDDNTFNFIHAACHTGITESRSNETYYSRRYRGACRVIKKD